MRIPVVGKNLSDYATEASEYLSLICPQFTLFGDKIGSMECLPET